MTLANINSEVNSLCSTDDTSYPVADKVRRFNMAQDKLVGLAINADGTWQFDDTNYTDRPRGTFDLSEGISVYTFSEELLEIEWLKIKDVNGLWKIIEPVDQLHHPFPFEDYDIDGMPQYYDKQGDSIDLIPAPTATDVTLTAGAKIQFKRKAQDTDTTAWGTGTTVPGLASPYHYLYALEIAIPYCMAYKKDRVALYEKRLDEGIKNMLKFYSRREKDVRKVFSMAPISFR